VPFLFNNINATLNVWHATKCVRVYSLTVSAWANTAEQILRMYISDMERCKEAKGNIANK